MCHVLPALSCYRLSHRDSTFVNWTAEQHLHDRCGLRDRTCVGPRRVSGLPGPVRGDRWPASQPCRSPGHYFCSVSSGRKASVSFATVTGAVLKKARARRYLGLGRLIAVLSSTGNAGSSLVRSVWCSSLWTCSKSLLTTSVWSAGRRSKGDNRIRWSRSSPL